ncbi:MAG: OsmC family protein [Bacteroidota bacterium]
MPTSTVTYLGQLRTEAQHIQSGTVINTDAPVDNKGKGEKFSPTDLVATALASCAMTLMGIAADTHAIPYTDVNASVEKIMAANPRRIDAIKIVFTIGDKLDDKQKKILENAAETCPVAKSLSHDLKQELNFVYTAD